MRMQQQRTQYTGCRFASQSMCNCGHCAKAVTTPASSNLYAAEFMLYAFHFGKEPEAPGKVIKSLGK